MAQVYRLFAALVALLLVMAVGFSMARWRATQAAGSPYGALTAVATPGLPAAAAPPQTAALAAAPAPVVAAPAVSAPVVSPPAVAADPAPAVVAPAPAPEAAPIRATPAETVAADPPRPQARVIALGKPPAGSAPLPAPAAAVAAAVAAQVAAPPAAAPLPAAKVAAATPAPADGTDAIPAAPPPDGLININTASADMLDHIPGGGRIGKTIVRHRPYASVQDLVDHRVLRAGDLARIRSHITTN